MRSEDLPIRRGAVLGVAIGVAIMLASLASVAVVSSSGKPAQGEASSDWRSPEERVVSADSRASEISPTPSTIALPACVPVSDHAGAVRGCVLREDLRPPSGESPADELNVYDDRGAVIGYFLAGGVGFVDKATGDDPADMQDIRSCFGEDDTAASVTPHCSEVLQQMGVPPRD